MRACASVACLAQLLDLAQQLACCFAYAALVRVVAALERDRAKRRGAAASVAFAAVALAAAVAVSLGGACRSVALYMGSAMSLLSSLCVVVAYVPQLAETWRRGHSGALSYATYNLSIVGCGIIFANDCFLDRDPWPAWLPSAVAGLVQLAIVGVAAVLDARGRRKGAAAAAAAGYAPLAEEAAPPAAPPPRKARDDGAC